MATGSAGPDLLGAAATGPPGHVIVTGGASGIGLATVGRLLQRGAAVTVLDVDADAVDRLSDDRSAHGERLQGLVVDVTDTPGVDQAMATATRAFGIPHRLFACAGTKGERLPALEIDVDAWRRLMDVHLFGTWAVCRAFARQLLGDDPTGVTVEASVVTVSSIVAAAGFTRQLDYGTAKAALSYLTKVLAVEWAPHGIRVNSVAPGYTATPMVEAMIAEGYDVSTAEARTPLGRLAQPDETARAVEFLLYDAGYVTGTVLHVDGGWTAVGR